VDVLLDEFVSSLEELSGEDDDGGGTISDFSILDLGEFDENLGSGVGNLELLEDSGAIISNGNITDIINKHFVEALGTERSLNNVRQTGHGSNYNKAKLMLDVSLL
jgi:hypothetical protein